MSHDSHDSLVPLTGIALYEYELRQLPQLSRAETDLLEQRILAGDSAARERYLIECARYVERRAAIYAHTYLRYDDLLDLAQVGNIALLEHVDEVLAKGLHIDYLCGVARMQMRNYAIYHSKLITLPDNRALPKELPVVVSLDRLALDTEEWDEIESLLATMATEAPMAAETLYGPLTQAIAALPEPQREVIIRRYGLDGGTTETLADLEKRLGTPGKHLLSSRYNHALEKLRKRLKQA